MASRFFAMGALGVLSTAAAIAAVTAVVTMRHPHLRPAMAPGNAHLRAFGSRGPRERQTAASTKFDGALADLSRHAALARPDHAVEDLHSIAPAVRFQKTADDAAPLVLIDAVTRGDPQQLKAALVALGLKHPAVYSNDVGGWLPVTQLEAAAAMPELHSIRAAMSRTRSGAVTSQGDFAQHSDVLRSANTLTGAGVTVGVLSDSFDCYSVYAANNVSASGAAGYANNGFLAAAATDVSTGDLPSGVNVLEEADCMNYGAPLQLPFSDEGRAMLQIVHDVAPGAGLAFYTAENSDADFANGIGLLAKPVASGGAGAKVIIDDVGYFYEPFFQDGMIAQAVDAVVAQGVAYFSAAGNDGTLAYENDAPSFPATSTSAPTSGEKLLNFDASGATTVTSLPVSIASLIPGEFVAIVVEWDQPYVTGAPHSGGATSHIDLCITGASGADIVEQFNTDAGAPVNCTGANTTGSDPYQIMIVANPANATGNTAAETLNIVVGLADGTAAPGRIKIAVEDDGAGSTINAFPGNSSSATLQGHPGAAGAAAVGAAFFLNTPACGTTPAGLEYFSSEGGTPILFDSAGNRLASPIVRQKPDFVGPNGGNDTFLGFALTASQSSTSIAGCKNNANYPNFFGTSAAAPHVASIAALMLQAKPALTPAQIYQALRASALPMDTMSPNFDSGYGFVQADTAFIVPVMSLAAGAVPVGGSTTLTWSTISAASCMASGSWNGPVATSGSQVVTITSGTINTYSLTCTNAAGASATNSVSLTDVAPALPILTLSTNSISLGDSATMTWSSANASSCTASGNWSGTLAAYGRLTVTPTTGGTQTYALSCSNAVGTSSITSADLTVLAPPAAPTLTLDKTSIVLGDSVTLTWSSANATSCTASGSWTGSDGGSGSVTVTPTDVGTQTYSLTCANSTGSSPATSVALSVTAAPAKSSGGGGGGGLDVLALLGLAGASMARILRFRRRVLI
jgi:Subtilase family